ncbi:MAG: Flp pilus assembly complex ATPase component TadA, partial [Deltaproteobacteria bacterium]|nr:Flp pilus assembly complex ATPase component TadA [Deltaproteobacteria bacterium]
MEKDIEGRFSVQNVCGVLVNSGVITKEKAQNVLSLYDSAKKKLEKSKAEKEASSPNVIRISSPITAIDVINALKIKRADGVSKELDEESIYQILSGAWGIEYKKIDPLKLDLNLVTTTIPRSFAMKHLVLPIDISEGLLTIATPNPFNVEVMDDITRVTQMKVKVVVSSKSDIIKLINEFFGFQRSIAAAETQFDTPAVDLGNLEQYVRLKSADEVPSNDQHIVNAVNHLLVYAFDQRASDIHIEPKRDITLVRMRIDGILHSVYKLPKKVHNAIVSRIKALSRFGEKVVMRIMDPDILFQDLEKLGYTGSDLARYNDFVSMPHGIVLVCGPTGSGKSTTLYSTLRGLSTPEINITTVEDPIEMVNEEFNQIAVQQAVGIKFSTILRNILRQDPDIIMIGEMRDLETAENAVQAAMTGHLVLSTLHTNDAPSSI